MFNARAYIRLSRRDNEDIAKDMLVILGKSFQDKNFAHLRKIYSTAVGRSKGLDKIWIVDVDKDNMVSDDSRYAPPFVIKNAIWDCKPE